MVWPPPSLRQRALDLRNTRQALVDLPGSTTGFTEQCLARYLVIRAAGYIEAVRDDAADQHTSVKASSEVTRRVRSNLRTGQGVAPSQLLEFMKSFHPDWHGELEEFLNANDYELKNKLGALVAARKKIAHGDGESVTTTRAIAWSEAAETIGKWLIRRFDPQLTTSSRIPGVQV